MLKLKLEMVYVYDFYREFSLEEKITTNIGVTSHINILGQKPLNNFLLTQIRICGEQELYSL